MILLFAFTLMHFVSRACEVCKMQQPKLLRGVTHGTGPQSDWDYVIVGSMVIIVAISIFYFLKSILRPRENERPHIHIKHSIFNLD
jgi:hypothetical protein